MGQRNDETRSTGSPGFASAYAVAYRLLGLRDISTDLASSVATRFASREDDPPPTWLPELVGETIESCLALASELPEEVTEPDDASIREALRRRLESSGAETRVAVGLHHLGGHSLERTAVLMEIDEATVERLCAPLAPPPGVTWSSLGDPLRRPPGRVSRGSRRRRIPLYPFVAAGVVGALVLWAVTSVGERPSVGDNGSARGATDSDATTVAPGGVLFDATLDPLPSAGCETADPDDPRSTDRQADIRGVPFPYRAVVPAGDGPAPLIVSIGDENVDPAAFQAGTRLEEALPESIHLTLEPVVADIPPVGGEVVPVIVEDAITGLCVDLGRVYVVGWGRGGEEATSALCAAPEVVVGAAVVSAAPSPEPDCLLDPASALWISARDDDPAVSTGDALAEVGTEWATLLQADDEVVNGADERTLIRRWSGPGGVTVTTRSQTDGGHEWNSLDTGEVVGFVAETARRLG